MKSVKLSGILVAALLFTANVFALNSNISFDQNGNTAAIATQINATTPDAEIIPEPLLNNKAEVLPAAQKKTLKKWTVMVFVNAKNNLESYGLTDVNEMEMIGSSDEVNIVAELGRLPGYSSADGNWTGSRRYLIKKDNNKSAITSPVLMNIKKSDMGDWKHLAEFANWSMEKFPAENYMLIVWNHGSGWNKDNMFESSKGISYDDTTNNHITTPQMKMAMAKIGKINIFSMDACLMQMAEVVYEIKDYTNYVVASEETEPGDGYTYNTFLGPLVNNPTMSGAELSKVTADSFVDHYASVGQSGTQSAINVSAFNKFAALLDEWVKTAMASNEKEAILSAKNSAQDFYYSSNKDIYHFIQLVAKNAKNKGLIAKSNELLKFMKDTLIVHSRATGYNYKNTYGLAVYMPSYSSSSYGNLQWAADTQWDEFISWYNK